MFVDLDWPLNASSLLSASAELLVFIECMHGSRSDANAPDNVWLTPAVVDWTDLRYANSVTSSSEWPQTGRQGVNSPAHRFWIFVFCHGGMGTLNPTHSLTPTHSLVVQVLTRGGDWHRAAVSAAAAASALCCNDASCQLMMSLRSTTCLMRRRRRTLLVSTVDSTDTTRIDSVSG